MINFSKNFYWGSAASAHQVEGNNHNDWTEWEKSEARIADLESHGLIKKYGRDNFISGRACDHYNRFREDFDIAKSLLHNAHRFSIEWSRIEPEEGKFDDKEIEHYREVIHALRERGIEPFVTLWHWTVPLWFSKKGGWEAPDAIRHFTSFAEQIAWEFKDKITYWIPLNEPALWSSMAYRAGVFPPGEQKIGKALNVYFQLIRAHQSTYRALKAINKNFQIGTAENMTWINHMMLRPFMNYFRNFYFLRRASEEIDFIGINYYRKVLGRRSAMISDLGWEVYPEGLYRELLILQNFRKPIFVTENGIADANDTLRPQFIREHLEWIRKAVMKGINVQGYFYWSLLDNFEWEKGFWPRFGLVEMDYKTMERKIRQSAYEYKKIIERYNRKIGLP